MDTILALREKRKNLWDAAKAFLDTARDENGKVTDKPLYCFLERYMQSYTDEMTEFIDCVLHDKPTKTTVEDGLQALRMGLAAKKSLAAPRPVKLSELEA